MLLSMLMFHYCLTIILKVILIWEDYIDKTDIKNICCISILCMGVHQPGRGMVCAGLVTKKHHVMERYQLVQYYFPGTDTPIFIQDNNIVHAPDK